MDLKIAVAGAGAVGGYVGAKLIKAGYDVTLIARGEHYGAIRENGLKILDYKDEFVVEPTIDESCGDDKFDIIFITTKSYAFEDACKCIKSAVRDDTLIIPLSEGVDHKSELKKYLDRGIFCDGTIYIISKILEPGVIDRKSFTFYLLFGSDREDNKFELLEDILNKSDLRAKYSKTIEYECWRKYLYVSSMGSLTSYFNKLVGYVADEQLGLLIDILIEIKKVANKKGIAIGNSDIEKAVNQAKRTPADSKTPMQIDFERKKQTELEAMCGYIIKEASKLGIEVPKFEMVYNELKNR